MEEKNINFFKKVWYSITKFDKYPDMATEGTKSALKYLMILSIIITGFLAINSIIEMHKSVLNIATYIEKEIPEFSYENNKIDSDIKDPVIIDNVKYNGIDKIVFAPSTSSTEEKSKIKQENEKTGITIFLFKDQIVLNTKIEEKDALEQTFRYDDFVKSYTQEDIKKFNKIELIDYLRSPKMNSFYMRYGLSASIYLFFSNIIVVLLNALELAILGWITATTLKLKFKFSALFNMAIYSLTLSTILKICYITINYFTEFTISYFPIAYITIAFVYMAAAIFLLKDDFIKRQQEVERIIKEQEKVREEILRQDEEPDEPDEEEKKEESDEQDTDEPKGSEA